jgi:hypothetical protein
VVRSEGLPHFVTHREQLPGDPGQGGGLCVRDPAVPKLFSQRIPLNAPHCQQVPDGARAGRPSAAEGNPLQKAIDRNLEDEPAGANPCMFLGPNESESDEPSNQLRHVKALFQNPHFRFVMTNLEDYVGDAASIQVSVVGGFSPLIVSSAGITVIGLGTRIVTGPDDSLDTGVALDTVLNTMPVPPPYFFVVDQGRTLTQFSRGQVLRINPRPLDADSLQGGFIDSIETDSLFPIQ